MRKSFTKTILFSMLALAMAFASCTDKAPVKEPTAQVPDSVLQETAENNLKAHQEDIQALWESYFGEGTKYAKYALAKDYVFLSNEDGKQGLLLSFYKDMKDIDNFDGIAVEEGQELAFLGDALVVKEKTDAGDQTMYFEKTASEGFNHLFTVTEKDGTKTFTDDIGKPCDEKEAQAYLEKVAKETASSLTELLGTWINL